MASRINSSLTTIALALASFSLAIAAKANANGNKGVIHKVGDKSETYEDLAEHYYGKRYLALHIRSFNRRAEPLAKGTTIIIPTYVLVPAKRGQSIEQFAEQNLSDASRADYLAELHGLRAKDRASLKQGLKLRVVPSLKHLVKPGESLRTIARLYYRDAGSDRLKLLKLYNNLANDVVKPGMSLRIPLDEPEFNYGAVSSRARRPFDKAPVFAELDRPQKQKQAPPAKKAPRPRPPDDDQPEGDADVKPEEPAAKPVPIADRLEELDRLCGDGEYETCEATARQVFESAPAAAPATKVEVLRIRAVALIALGRVDEGKETFRRLLVLDPEYDLDLYRTSPKILDVFQAVAER